MKIKTSTISRKAIKGILNYSKNRYSFRLGYERVDPDYRTLGAYYFVNNMENITLNISTNFFNNKINIAGNIGIQKNNLNNNEMNNTKRFVSSVNINIIPNKKLTLNTTYSNFNSYTNVRSTFDYINETNPYQNYDTLNFRQISQNANFNSNYKLENSKEQIQSIGFNIIWQQSTNKQGNNKILNSNFYNSNLTYSFTYKPMNLTCYTSLNFNVNEEIKTDNYTWGPIMSITKTFLNNKLKTSISISYNEVRNKKFYFSKIFNSRLNITYSIKKQHNLNFSLLYQKNKRIKTSSNDIINMTLGYVFNFNIMKEKK